jgi:MerR family copper efflux transcriptional regulator
LERVAASGKASVADSGYRSYDDDAVARLTFVAQAKRIGLTLEQISDLLAIWDGVNCPATHDQISQLVDAKLAEVLERIDELHAFAERLSRVGDALRASPPPAACRPDMSCCVPIGNQPVAPAPVAYLSDLRSRDTTLLRS